VQHAIAYQPKWHERREQQEVDGGDVHEAAFVKQLKILQPCLVACE